MRCKMISDKINKDYVVVNPSNNEVLVFVPAGANVSTYEFVDGVYEVSADIQCTKGGSNVFYEDAKTFDTYLNK
jgi:hypothetical protein